MIVLIYKLESDEMCPRPTRLERQLLTQIQPQKTDLNQSQPLELARQLPRQRIADILAVCHILWGIAFQIAPALVGAFGAGVDADEFWLKLYQPASAIFLAEAVDDRARDDGVLVDPIERSANAIFPFGRAVFGREIGAACVSAIPVFNIGIAGRAESYFCEMDGHWGELRDCGAICESGGAGFPPPF